MDYVITFSDVMAAVITLGLGAIGFFMKRWIGNVEQGEQGTATGTRKYNRFAE